MSNLIKAQESAHDGGDVPPPTGGCCRKYGSEGCREELDDNFKAWHEQLHYDMGSLALYDNPRDDGNVGALCGHLPLFHIRGAPADGGEELEFVLLRITRLKSPATPIMLTCDLEDVQDEGEFALPRLEALM